MTKKELYDKVMNIIDKINESRQEGNEIWFCTCGDFFEIQYLGESLMFHNTKCFLEENPNINLLKYLQENLNLKIAEVIQDPAIIRDVIAPQFINPFIDFEITWE